ncbi:sigma-70 family RNA polymerase sigma factor [Roseivivax sediminis]|uniref:sigma-70 family RNA polymerase sigma factor n=1 Tax=Roseivivax sediminis TaxID=936889 RepID=UPI00122C5E3E|nr:sigma-70 family RNA polymerase sigma factor [Roseivivax sediminis]
MTPFSDIFPSEHPPYGFHDPAHLLGWLHGSEGDPDARNGVLQKLLRAAHGEGRGRDLAVELLILVLWPGLCVVRQRLRAFAQRDTLDADLLGQITIGIRAARPDRVSRVAATLLRNAERDLRRAWQRDANASWPDPDCAGELHREGSNAAGAPEAIIALAHSALGADGVLVTAVHIAGFSQKEAGEILGLGHEAARKRCQRIMAQLRESADA